LNRADPDFAQFLTAKTQLKIKERESNTMAKSLQPITVAADHYLFKFGPSGVYLLDRILENCPDHWFFYAKKTPVDMKHWFAAHFPQGCEYQMNDQKGQDMTVVGWAVVFFSELLRHFGFDEEMIQDFKTDKCTKEIAGKVQAIRTDSGEVWTYLLNTCSAAARECAMYDLPFGLPMANGGDDLIRQPFGHLTQDYLAVKHLDPTIDKRYVSYRGDFVSYMIKDGITAKDPIILLKRLLVRISRGELKEIMLGYFDLWAQNYSQKDDLYRIFDEDEMRAHSCMTRIMFNMRKEGFHQNLPWDRLDVPYEFLDNDTMKTFQEHSDLIEQFTQDLLTPTMIMPNMTLLQSSHLELSNIMRHMNQ
jgi:hypothetical protein